MSVKSEQPRTPNASASESPGPIDAHASRPEFVAYYEAGSMSDTTRKRFETVQRKILHLWAKFNERKARDLAVLDIGCGAGTFAMQWARQGYRAHGVDIGKPLIELAQRRAAEAGLDARFELASATHLPYADDSMDICALPQLLEHVQDWQGCLSEAARVLRPGGVLYLSTTNVLCPLQNEFQLPLYSWYPGLVKRRFERLAVTTRPELANYATHPAVNWFTFFEIEAFLDRHGLRSFDRFDMLEESSLSPSLRVARAVIIRARPARWAAYLFSPFLAVFAVKRPR